MLQPTILRRYKSITHARYKNPLCVAMYVMSHTHLRLGASAEKSRSSRFSKTRCSWLESLADLEQVGHDLQVEGGAVLVHPVESHRLSFAK
jgi:hypothetical protein